MTDFERTIFCMTICPQGVNCLEEDTLSIQKYNPFFSQLKETSRRPDAYAVIERDMLLLEHFQFDNTRTSKKGSEQHKVAAKSEQEFKKKLVKDGDLAVLGEDVKKKGIYYVENFLAQFISHYDKIDDYKTEMQKELKKDFKNIYMGFLIEDASPLGSLYLNNNHKMCCLDLLQTKEFLDIFEQSSKLDFALFSMTGNADNLYQSYISRRSIGERRKNEIIAKNISSFLFEHSFVASGLIEIQKNKKP